MNIININETLSGAVLDKLIKFYNKRHNDADCTIYISTSGGCTLATEAIIDLINRYKSITTIIAYGKLFSSGFDVFFRTSCKKILLPSSVGMYHLSSLELTYNENGKPNYKSDVQDLKYIKAQKERTMSVATSLNFTEKESKKLSKGKDVYFQYNRLKELLEN